MNGGIATLLTFTLIAVLIAFLGVALGDPTMSTIAIINVLLGALIGFPLLFVGKASVKRAARLLSTSQTQIGQKTLNPLERPGDLSTSGLNAGPRRLPMPDSVTEHTTLDLQERARISRNSTSTEKQSH